MGNFLSRRKSGEGNNAERVQKQPRMNSYRRRNWFAGLAILLFDRSHPATNCCCENTGPVSIEEITTTGYKVAGRYEVLEVLGGGTFGRVLKVNDTYENKVLAMKVTKHAGKSLGGDGVRELLILKQLRRMDNRDKYHIVRILNGFPWRERFCFLFELMPVNLRQYVDEVGFGQGLPVSQTITITLQLIDAVCFIHRLKLVHCDLKPDNIMVKNRNTLEVKIIDFGSAAHVSKPTLTNYNIQTRYYRAPEVILEIPYGQPIDLWSIGCIISQMHTGSILFPGESEETQLFHQIELLGVPPMELLYIGGTTNLYFEMEPISDGLRFRPNDKYFEQFPAPSGDIRLNDAFNWRRVHEQSKLGNGVGIISLKECQLFQLMRSLLSWQPSLRMKPEIARNLPLFKAQPVVARRRFTIFSNL